MTDDAIEVALECSHCREETIHHLIYVGRILSSTTCTVCHTQIKHEVDDLRIAYVKDLEHRIVTKPFRLWRRFRKAPVTTTLEIPRKTMGKPLKLWHEIKSLLK